MATDKVGNQSEESSGQYTVNLSEPTVTVTKDSETDSGVTYSYTITPGDSDIVSVQIPDGCRLPDDVTLPTGVKTSG